jgi:hypothetical protein
MRSNVKRHNRGTSTADLASAADLAYVPSGEGQWSRHAAHSGQGDATRTRERQEFSRLDVQIQKEMAEVIRHERRANEATEPGEVAKHIERALKTRRFLDRLRREQKCADRVYAHVEWCGSSNPVSG